MKTKPKGKFKTQPWHPFGGKVAKPKGKKRTAELEHKKLLNEVLHSRYRLRQIAEIIEGVETRCMAVDGPVTCTRDEITLREIKAIYKLAKGKP